MESGGKILIEPVLCEAVAAVPRGKTSGCTTCPCKLPREPDNLWVMPCPEQRLTFVLSW